MKKLLNIAFVLVLASILLCSFILNASAATVNTALLNPSAYLDDPDGTPCITFVATHKNSSGYYDRCFLLAAFGDADDIASSDGVSFVFHSMYETSNNTIYCDFNYYINNINWQRFSNTFDTDDLIVSSLKNVRVICGSSDHAYLNGLTFNSLSSFVTYAEDGIPFAGGERDPIYGYPGNLPLIIELEFGELVEAPYVPPYSPGEIESGFQEVVTGLQGIESDLILETIAPGDLGVVIGGQDHITINPDVNAVAPLRHFLNNSFVLTLLLCVFGYATLSFVLFGKKA